jgi:5-methylcytosine-specific restriction endonuclease McrA
MPVKMQPEPACFYEKVQKKGDAFLAKNPGIRKLPDYWKVIIPDLYDAYRGICAYTCHWISDDTGWKTVNHFKPKRKYPEEAYRWSNYRLVCGVFNGRKSDYEDVLDPFTLQEGWFVIVFPSLQLKPASHLTEDDA